MGGDHLHEFSFLFIAYSLLEAEVLVFVDSSLLSEAQVGRDVTALKRMGCSNTRR